MPAMLIVSDLAASLKFYTETLGMQLVDRLASAAALRQQEVEIAENDRGAIDEMNLKRGIKRGLLVRNAGGSAGPTRDELQQLDWRIIGGGERDTVGLQSATLRHADGTWLRLLQVGPGRRSQCPIRVGLPTLCTARYAA